MTLDTHCARARDGHRRLRALRGDGVPVLGLPRAQTCSAVQDLGGRQACRISGACRLRTRSDYNRRPRPRFPSHHFTLQRIQRRHRFGRRNGGPRVARRGPPTLVTGLPPRAQVATARTVPGGPRFTAVQRPVAGSTYLREGAAELHQLHQFPLTEHSPKT